MKKEIARGFVSYCKILWQMRLGSFDQPCSLLSKVYWTTLCIVCTLYLYFSRRTHSLSAECYLHAYISRTYLSFTIDLSQTPERKVGVCSNSYQYQRLTIKDLDVSFYASTSAFMITIGWVETCAFV